MLDLHCHTTASDGILSPGDLIKQAAASGLEYIAVCDHDTVSGVEEAVRVNSKVQVIPGVELSVAYKGGTFHLLGLFVDYTNQDLVSELSMLAALRGTRSERIFDDLKKHGVDIPYNEVQDEAHGAAIGKPHFARVMIRHGYGTSMDDIFSRYLADGLPGDVSKERVDVKLAIQKIHAAGGCAVIAHPVTLNCSHSDFEIYFEKLIGYGIDGIEVYAALHSEEDVAFYSKCAESHNLLITGGSDFHGDKNEKLGFYGNGRCIPDWIKNGLSPHVRR